MQVKTIELGAVRLALLKWRLRWVAYTQHPLAGSACWQTIGPISRPWRAIGGSMPSPPYAGQMRAVLDRVHSRGRAEVIRTFGCGIRAMRAELAARPEI